MKRSQLFLEADGGGNTGTGGEAGGAATLLSGTPDGQQPGAAAATPAPWIAEDGTFGADWLNKLPENLRGEASLKVMPSFTKLAESYVETKRMVGKKLEAPGENATPEQVANWRKTVGAPEKPEGYLGDAKTLRPDSVPEEYWNPEGEKAFLALAHKHHLPAAAVKDIIAFQANVTQEQLKKSGETETSVLAEQGTKLKEAWGQEYDKNLSLAARMAKTVGLDPATHPAFTSAEVVQAFAKMGKLLSEDKLVTGGTDSINGSIAGRVQDITDPKSSSQLAREYRGEFGPERQASAQKQYHDLLNAQNS